jgi:hypothetical protein
MNSLIKDNSFSVKNQFYRTPARPRISPVVRIHRGSSVAQYPLAWAGLAVAMLAAWAGVAGAADPAGQSKGKSTPPPVAAAAAEPEWQDLFDGLTLTGWCVTDFAGHGEVRVVRSFKSEKAEPGVRGTPAIVMDSGAVLTGINWTNAMPKMNYEVSLEALKIDGSDFFCGLTFPVRDTFCSLIVGGWGGGVVGISSLNDYDASENDTTKFMSFESGHWYRIRVRVIPNRIQAWIDKEKVIDVDTTDRKISLRPGDIEMSKPFGVAAYQTGAALRDLKWARLPAPTATGAGDGGKAAAGDRKP